MGSYVVIPVRHGGHIVRRITLFTLCSALAAFVCFGNARAASTITAYAVPTLQQSANAYCGSATSCSVTLPNLPQTGDALICTTADLSGASFALTSGPAGLSWPQIGASMATFNNVIGLVSYQHVDAASAYAALSSPNAPTVATSTTGGTLAAATYYYTGAALNGGGEITLASTQTSQVTTGSTSKN